jgi:hypothetical protein
MSQWHFVDDAMVPPLHSILGSLSTFQESTGRVMKITVEEGRNLAARDRSGKSDPYVLLQYGKVFVKNSRFVKIVLKLLHQLAHLSAILLISLRSY